jgi:hypothetical protein
VPQNLLAAADALRAEAAALHDDVEQFRRSQRVKNVMAAVAMAVLAVAVVAIIVLAIDQSNQDENNALERCQATNEGRVAIKDAFADDHATLQGVVAEFINPDSEDGQRFLDRLEAEHAASEKRLAVRLPELDCGKT